MDLRHRYSDHNNDVLDQLIEVVSFRRECETKQAMERWKQDDQLDN